MHEGAAVRKWDVVSSGLCLRRPGTGVTGGIGLLASCLGKMASAAVHIPTSMPLCKVFCKKSIPVHLWATCDDCDGCNNFEKVTVTTDGQALANCLWKSFTVAYLGLLSAEPTSIQPEIKSINRVQRLNASSGLQPLPRRNAIADAVVPASICEACTGGSLRLR